MKHISIYQYVLPLILCLLLFACGKDSEEPDSQGIPPPSFLISFYAVDSLGNLAFPIDGPYLTEYTPDDYSASSQFGPITGGHNDYPPTGHIFRMAESYSEIYDHIGTDSTFFFILCFASDCDTVRIYNPNYSNDSNYSSAEWIYWNGDTIHNHLGIRLPYTLSR